jgi:hypothetical protein
MFVILGRVGSIRAAGGIREIDWREERELCIIQQEGLRNGLGHVYFGVIYPAKTCRSSHCSRRTAWIRDYHYVHCSQFSSQMTDPSRSTYPSTDAESQK